MDLLLSTTLMFLVVYYWVNLIMINAKLFEALDSIFLQMPGVYYVLPIASSDFFCHGKNLELTLFRYHERVNRWFHTIEFSPRHENLGKCFYSL